MNKAVCKESFPYSSSKMVIIKHRQVILYLIKMKPEIWFMHTEITISQKRSKKDMQMK